MIPKIVWDEGLPPAREVTVIEKWDEWFANTGDEESIKTWNAAKSVHTDPKVLEVWATIAELNRLNRLKPTKEET